MSDWLPNAGPQLEFLSSEAYEVLYGGAAGGGKTDAILMGALDPDCIAHPKYKAILFRRTVPELEETFIPRSKVWFPRSGAVYRSNPIHEWTFPSGAKIRFGYLDRDDDVQQYQSAEFDYIGFDELTHYSEFQYTYMQSRLRGSMDLPKLMRAGSNPGGGGHEWVQKRWGPWLGGPDWTGPRAEPGEALWVLNTDDGPMWVPRGTQDAESRVFIPAKLDDNPKLDPGYRRRLMGLDPLSRAQLLHGNWLIRASPGLFFKREWFKFADVAPGPSEGRTLRFWDRAATEELESSTGKPKNDPDWTVGVKMMLTWDGRIYILDVQRFRESPGQVKRRVKATAELDGREVGIRFSIDPGSAGKFEFADWLITLNGWDVQGAPESGDKISRAKPISAQVEGGNVYLVRAPWNQPLIDELEAFPTKGVHDDQVDGLSGAHAFLTGDPVAQLNEKFVTARKSLRGD